MARSLNGIASNGTSGTAGPEKIRISSHDSSHRVPGAARRRPAGLRAVLCLIVLAVIATGQFTAAPVQAQSAALASVQAQIRRYGCNLPQYANSVPGCRQLHAQARALAGGASSPPQTSAYRAPAPVYQSRPVPQTRSGGGLFGFLFGAPNPNRYRRRDTFSSDQDYYYSPAPSAYGSGGYRTLCVRLCDGYYWPISYSTSRYGLARDAQRCESSCGAPAKLFYYRNPGGSVEGMVDLQGNPYANLENAFRYRTEYVSACRCKPEPWSEAAKEEYERRAEAAEADTSQGSAEVADAGETSAPPADDPAAAHQGSSISVVPYPGPAVTQRYRRRQRTRNSFNPFGRWFN